MMMRKPENVKPQVGKEIEGGAVISVLSCTFWSSDQTESLPANFSGSQLAYRCTT